MKSEYIDVEYVDVIEEYNVLTQEYVQANPSIIGVEITKLAKSIEDSKSDIEKIKCRNLFERLTANNTKDLANLMLKQNETTTAFLTVVQGIIFLSMNNVSTLASIMDSMDRKAEVDDIKDNKYISMTKDYLTEAIKSAKKIQENEAELERQAKIIENLKEIQQNSLAEINTLENTIHNINKNIKIKSYFFIVLIICLVLIKI